MNPNNLFNLFPPFPRENKVFVAMSFDSRCDKRWNDVIFPAINNITINEKRLEPYRVDKGKGSNSIISDIIMGIGNCQLFFADLTTVGYLEKKPVRNENVMYEIGIAHSIRLPEEVILFKSDDDPLLFDLSNTRVNKYNPDDEPEDAKQKISEAIISTNKEIDLQKHLSISKAANSLDIISWKLILESLKKNGVINHPKIVTVADSLAKRDTIASIQRLLELGIISTQYSQITPVKLTEPIPVDLLTYTITPFGNELIMNIFSRIGLLNPDVLKLYNLSK